MRLGIVLGVAALLLFPRLARADEAAGCGPLAATQALVARLGGAALAPASEAQAEFLRAALIAEPGADASALYSGETLLASLADGGAAAVYVVDGRACGLALLGPSSAAILAAIGRAPGAYSKPRCEGPAAPLAAVVVLACLCLCAGRGQRAGLPVASIYAPIGGRERWRPTPAPATTGRSPPMRAPLTSRRCRDHRWRGMASGDDLVAEAAATSARASSPGTRRLVRRRGVVLAQGDRHGRRWRTGWRRARFATARMSPTRKPATWS